MSLTTWRKEITSQMNENNETWDSVEACTLSQEELDIEFCDGFGSSNGKPFTVWTKNFVYFPGVYDGMEWVDSVPRNPCSVAKNHVGGE